MRTTKKSQWMKIKYNIDKTNKSLKLAYFQKWSGALENGSKSWLNTLFSLLLVLKGIPIILCYFCGGDSCVSCKSWCWWWLHFCYCCCCCCWCTELMLLLLLPTQLKPLMLLFVLHHVLQLIQLQYK